MAEIINIQGGRGFESNEDRILELNRQIEACQDRIFQLHALAVHSDTSDERDNIRHEEMSLRSLLAQLTEELNRL
jgi:hypothetical protein